MTVGGGGSVPPDGWQLSAHLKPKEPDAPPAKTGGEVEVPPPPAWVEAASDLRTTVKWLVTAFAAVGAVMFAKGFVTTPELSWESDATQLVWAWVVGALGLFALGWLLFQAVEMLRPTLYELGDLPPGYEKLVNREPRFYLPSHAKDLDEFLTQLDELRTGEIEWRAKVARSDEALKAAKEAQPPDQAKIDSAAGDLRNKTATHASFVRELALYNRTRNNLLNRAGYWKASRGLDAGRATMVTAAVLAAAGGIGYQLLLASPAAEADKVAAPASATVGELIRNDTEAGRELWQQLRLAPCQADPASARIAVVVTSGKGTQAEPYVVSTIPTEQCVAATFTVVDDVARVNLPPKTVITYTPAPTCPSGTGSPPSGSSTSGSVPATSACS